MPETIKTNKQETIAGNLDTSFLKVLAFVFMFIDHLGKNVFPGVTEMRIIGRMALPLYAWCLVVGAVKTRSPLRYALRLLVMAAVSQPIYMMALNHTWTELNILFTLFFALVCLLTIRVNWMGSQFWGPALCFFILGCLTSAFGVSVDYGWKGILFVIMLYLARESRSGLCSTYLAYALFWGSGSAVKTLFGYPLHFLSIPGLGSVLTAFFRMQSMVWLSLPLVACKTKTNIKLPKWLGYGLYPMHLIVLIVIKLLSGASFAVLFRGF